MLSFRRANMIGHTLEQRFAKWGCDRLTENNDFGKKKIIFSDEAHFDLGGYANKQIYRIWGTVNPHAYIEKPMHPKRVTFWCGFWSRGIIRPFFCENEQRIWLCISLNNASLSGPAIDSQKTPILAKRKSSFQMKPILIFVCM